MSDECQCICHRLEAGLGMHHAVDCCSLSGIQGKRYRELLAAEEADDAEQAEFVRAMMPLQLAAIAAMDEEADDRSAVSPAPTMRSSPSTKEPWMADQRYGEAPVGLDYHELEWHEFMHWLYLPVRLPAREDDHRTIPLGTGIELPPNIMFLYDVIAAAWADAAEQGFEDPYIYVTARRGWATAENPLNRPGWHCDGFGTDDLNYVWCDEFPTVWSPGPFTDISADHLESLAQFERQARDSETAYGTSLAPDGLLPTQPLEPYRLYRFSPFVVHTAPRPWNIGAGGMRSFLKVSVSDHRYNLVGNSRNHELTYRWDMHPRSVLRNDPHRAGFDYFEPTL